MYDTVHHSRIFTCIFRMTQSRKYFVSGADNGVVRIQQAPAPGQLMGNDDESRYWEVRVADSGLYMAPISHYQ